MVVSYLRPVTAKTNTNESHLTLTVIPRWDVKNVVGPVTPPISHNEENTVDEHHPNNSRFPKKKKGLETNLSKIGTEIIIISTSHTNRYRGSDLTFPFVVVVVVYIMIHRGVQDSKDRSEGRKEGENLKRVSMRYRKQVFKININRPFLYHLTRKV